MDELPVHGCHGQRRVGLQDSGNEGAGLQEGLQHLPDLQWVWDAETPDSTKKYLDTKYN